MHKICSKENQFNSADISILGHSFGASKFPKFYDKIKKKYQISPRLYVGSYEGEKGDQILK